MLRIGHVSSFKAVRAALTLSHLHRVYAHFILPAQNRYVIRRLMKRSRPAAVPDPAPPPSRARLTSLSHASRHLGLAHASPHPFFDRLPEDALILIVQRLAVVPAPAPHACPVLTFARVSPEVRRVVAQTVGSRLAFSVYGNSDWFWSWLAVAGPHVRELSLHNRSYRSAGDVRHLWGMWPRRPVVQLDPFSSLGAVRVARAALKDLDVSGMQSFRRTGLAALEALLLSVRGSLRGLTIDLDHFRITHAVASARLCNLRRLTIVNISERSEHHLLTILRSMEGQKSEGSSLKELWLDGCDCIPTVFRKHRQEFVALLPKLESFHFDYDDELQNFSSLSSAALDNLCAAATLPTVQRVCFSGSGVPVTQRLISEIRSSCSDTVELRLIDCDIDPSERPGTYTPLKRCNEALSCTGTALTHYYPRWVTFKLDQLYTLARHCLQLTHLRIFTAPGAEQALAELGRNLKTSLVDLEVYPKEHDKKPEMAGTIVRLIQDLTVLERLCLVTLDLSAGHLNAVLEHCGRKLKSFSFSPPAGPTVRDETTAECIADVLISAARHNPNLQRLQCILPNDTVPVVESAGVANRLKVALRLLESRATRLESSSISSLITKMSASN